MEVERKAFLDNLHLENSKALNVLFQIYPLFFICFDFIFLRSVECSHSVKVMLSMSIFFFINSCCFLMKSFFIANEAIDFLIEGSPKFQEEDKKLNIFNRLVYISNYVGIYLFWLSSIQFFI